MHKLYQYSQASLQDFADCNRRFFYRHYSQQSWPAVVSEPAVETEKLARLGEQFHRLVKQYLLGVPADLLADSFILQGDLEDWWQTFLDAKLIEEGAALYPEKVLTGFAGDHKLAAKFDLLVVQPDDSVIIYDWKTTRKQPARAILAQRWQTIIYPFLVAKSGHVVNFGEMISPGKIKMVYWYANFPDKPISFTYSEEDFRSDEEAILALIERVESLESIEEFAMTDNDQRCVYCVFRSLCDRGVRAGEGFEEEFDPRDELEFDFEQIQEIEF